MESWTTPLPEQCQFPFNGDAQCLPATFGDGRLAVVASLPGPKIHVWVLIDDDHGLHIQEINVTS